MNDAVTTLGLWTAAILGLAAVLAGAWKGIRGLAKAVRWIDKMNGLVVHELNHNSGSSMKDHTRTAAEESQIANVLLREALEKIGENTKEIRAARREHREFLTDQMAWNEATERELDRAWSMLGKRGPTDGTSDGER